MRLAVLGDIHANHRALEAVLARIYAEEYDGPFPAENGAGAERFLPPPIGYQSSFSCGQPLAARAALSST